MPIMAFVKQRFHSVIATFWVHSSVKFYSSSRKTTWVESLGAEKHTEAKGAQFPILYLDSCRACHLLDLICHVIEIKAFE